jgi:hypothetical protein
VLAGDEVLTTAILDRLLHRSHVLNITGRSYWLRELKRAVTSQRNGWPGRRPLAFRPPVVEAGEQDETKTTHQRGAQE